MPRPPSAPETLARYEASARAAVREALLFVPGPELLPVLLEACISGEWLREELLRVGATEEETYRLTFAAGQMCVGRDAWEVAQTVLTLFKEGEPPAPGPELAERLLRGDVSDLPPGGLRIRTVPKDEGTMP